MKMSLITFLFSLFILINKTKEYYNLKYGNILLDYYKEEYCINSPVKRIKYPINETEYITVLNSEGYSKNYDFSFDFFSSSIYYTNETGEEKEDEKNTTYKRSLNCNGLCYKRQENSDILMDPDDLLVGYYPDLDEKYRYFSCIYNNIITSAIILIDIYKDDKCKNKLNEIDTYEFKGNETCWEFNETYSLRPLYFEDGDKNYIIILIIQVIVLLKI